MEQFRADLRAAGINDGKDERGRWVMFHSLRHTLNNSLARAGVDLTMRRLVMRHSDSRLTEVTYLDEKQLPTAGLTDRLPTWEKPTEVAAAVKTGSPSPPGGWLG